MSSSQHIFIVGHDSDADNTDDGDDEDENENDCHLQQRPGWLA